MDITQLISEIAKPIGKKKAVDLSQTLIEQNFNLNQLIELSNHHIKEIGFRASWILEISFKNRPAYLKRYEKAIIAQFPSVSNPSCQRHFCNIMKQILSQRKHRNNDFIDFEPVIEHCFDWLIDPRIAVAVKSCCCDILFQLSKSEEWIREELAEQLVFLMKTGSPAIIAKGNNILKKFG